MAASHGALTSKVEALLAAGANAGRADKRGRTSLIIALANTTPKLADSAATAMLLIAPTAAAGAIDAMSRDGMTALLWAQERKMTTIVAEIRKAGAQITDRGRDYEAEEKRAARDSYQGCALAQESFNVRYCAFTSPSAPFAPFWPSAQACLDFTVNMLPDILQLNAMQTASEAVKALHQFQGIDATAATPLEQGLLAACLRDDWIAVERLLKDGALLGATCGTSPLTVAARWGNWRTVRLLVAKGATTSQRDQFGRLAVTYAAEGCFVPTVEVLLGRPAGDIDMSDLEKMELSPAHVRSFQAALSCFTKMKANLVAEEAALPLKSRAIHAKRAYQAEAFAKMGGPTSLELPQQSQEEFLANTIELPAAREYAYYICHAIYPPNCQDVVLDDSTDENMLSYFQKKAASVQRAAELLAKEQTDEFGVLPVFLCTECIPQWDITLKWLHLQSALHVALTRSARMLLVLTEATFRRYWVMEELLLFAKWNGYGSLRCAPPVSCEWSDVAQYTRGLLQQIETPKIGSGGGIFGASDGSARSRGLFTECLDPGIGSLQDAVVVSEKEGFTYAVGPVPAYLDRDAVLNEIFCSFEVWAEKLAVGFQLVQEKEEPHHSGLDFKIQWGYPKARPNEAEFLLSGSLALTQDRVVYLNPNKTWKLRDGPGEESFELVTVMTHEIGHLFGFLHSDDQDSIMHPRYRPGLCSRQ